jgi:hypothetical protein
MQIGWQIGPDPHAARRTLIVFVMHDMVLHRLCASKASFEFVNPRLCCSGLAGVGETEGGSTFERSDHVKMRHAAGGEK